MEQRKNALEHEVQIAAQRLAAARQEGQSQESIRQLCKDALCYAKLLRTLNQPAVPNQGMLCLLVYTCFVTEDKFANIHSTKHRS